MFLNSKFNNSFVSDWFWLLLIAPINSICIRGSNNNHFWNVSVGQFLPCLEERIQTHGRERGSVREGRVDHGRGSERGGGGID